MDRIFLIDKKEGITSFDVVFKLRKKFNIKKIGHTGTLDPFATGLLILCCGEATKISNYILSSKKTYVATLRLGIATDTLDKDGKVVETKDVPFLTKEDILRVFNNFVGDIKQVPPSFSAIKINGKKAYELARKGIEVDIKERVINIEKIDLLSFDKEYIKFEVTCSKGTYIRTLASDIAKELNTVGHLTELRRTNIDNFDIKDSKTIEDVEENDGFRIKDALNFKQIKCTGKLLFDVQNGKKIKLNENDEYLLMLDNNGNELAIYQKIDDYYSCVRGFNICK